MVETKDKKKEVGGYSIDRGSELLEGTPPANFSKNEDPHLTKPKKSVNLKKPKKQQILPKHRGILKQMVKNGGVMTEAMIAMSYSENYARKRHSAIKNSKSWQALMDEHLPQDLLAERHMELLNKRARRNIYNDKGEIIKYGVDDGPDTSAVTKALEMAYRLRGEYKKDDEDVVKKASVTYNLFYKPGVQESIKTFEDQLVKQIYHEIDEDNTKTSILEGPEDDRENQEGDVGVGGEEGVR